MNFEGRRDPAALKKAKISRFSPASFSACVLGAFWMDFGSILGTVLVTLAIFFGIDLRSGKWMRRMEVGALGWRQRRGPIAKAKAGI